jgi:hypothetical protein
MTKMRTGFKGVPVHVFLAIACALAAGCTGETNDTSFPDENALRALDSYEVMYRLDANGRVNNLRLEGRHLPDAMMAEVGKLTELDEMSLAGASFSEDSLAHLYGLKYLRRLGLGGTPITDKALVHLEKLEGLTEVWLTTGQFSPAALEKLKSARPDLTVHL